MQQIHALERRRLLTQLIVSGTTSADAINLSVAGYTRTGLDVRVTNNGHHPVTVTVDRRAVQLAAAETIRTEQILSGGVTVVQLVDLGGGDDRLTTAAAIDVRVIASGGSGNDTITGGSVDDQIDGGPGDDCLSGGKGRDTITGGDGSDSIDGGSGNDTLYGGTLLPVPSVANPDGHDVVAGGVGDDRIYASTSTSQLDGNDALYGGPSPDTLSGGDGNDTMDAVDGGADSISGDAGYDVADYGTATQGLNAYVDNPDGDLNTEDLVVGVDTVSLTTDALDLGSGDDTFGASAVVNYGTGVYAASLTVHMGAGNDNIVEGADQDDPTVLPGQLIVYGDAGNDLLSDYQPLGKFYGGDGNDTVDVEDVESAVQEQLPDFDGGPGNDSISGYIGTDLDLRNFSSVENGSVFFGNVTGTDAANTLSTDEGDLFGLGGNDTLAHSEDKFRGLFGGNLYGGDGNDQLTLTYDLSYPDGPATSLIGGAGNDTLQTNLADPELFGDLEQDGEVGSVLIGNGGNDQFVNQNGLLDTIDGGDGFDIVQDDDTAPDTPGIQNDITSNVEYVYDTLGEHAAAPQAVAHAAGDVGTPAAVAAPIVVSGVSVGIDAKGVLRVTGTAAADTIELSQTGSTVTAFVGSKSAGTYATSRFKSVAIDAGAGNDTVRLVTASGRNPLLVPARVHGGDGNDTLVGGSNGDQLAGEGGDDLVTGGSGNDVLSGDFIVLKGEAVPAAALVPDGSDTVAGGGGSTDVVSYTNRTTAVTINMGAGTVVSLNAQGKVIERDKVTGVALMVGSQSNDALTGSANDDLLFGGPGNDTLTGGAGVDQLRSGVGADSINPDSGNDFIDTGPDTVVDRINGSLVKDAKGIFDLPRGPGGALLFGVFNRSDYFTLSGHYFGDRAD